MFATRLGLPFALLLALSTAANGQVAYPPKPEKYAAAFRYRIRTDQEERIRQYRAMEQFLKKLGFEPAPREDADLDVFDPAAERMDGTIPAANAARLLESQSIVTVVLVPAGQQLPADGKTPVQVRIRLATGLGAKEQADLHRQVVAHLGLLGFVEAIGYDHAGYSLARGSLPAENLYRLLKDLRTQPSGWFAPAVGPASLPLPLRSVMPIRLVEVLPDAAAPSVAPPPAGPPAPATPKLTPEARAAIEDPANQGKPLRVDLVLEAPPGLAWRDVKVRIRTSALGASVEGLVGTIATVRVNKPADVAGLTALPEVRSVRLPRAGSETVRPQAAAGVDPAAWLRASNIADLHRAGYRGAGVRVVVVASGFPGVTSLIGKRLPASTRVIDLTAELTPEVEPLPPAADRPGGGTAAAIAAHAAAPAAELVLVRVEPTALHQLETVARAVAGNGSYSDAMQSRSIELVARTDALTLQRTAVTEEYRQAFADLSDEEGPTKRRAAAKAAFDKLVADELVLKGAVERFGALKTAVDGLRGGGVVVNTLTWDTGYPLDGLSDLSRLIDDLFQPKPVASALRASRRPPVPVWVQPASTAVGQVWAGPFLDADANGVMEFTPATAPVPAGQWNRELNFLGFAGADGKVAAVLPAGLKVRATIQWREPHDPDAGLAPEPVFPLDLRMLRQLDPEGKALATDEFAEVGLSGGQPVRLLKTLASGAFEQTLEVTIPAEGVYALRVEGRPAAAATFGSPQRVEVYPRVVIEPADPVSAAKGRPVFRTYTGNAIGVGVPGDSPAAVTVGVEGGAVTLTGTGPGVALGTKPDLLAPGVLAIDGNTMAGPGVAAGFAAGTAASLLSAGARINDLPKVAGLKPGDPLMLPKKWVDTLRPRTER